MREHDPKHFKFGYLIVGGEAEPKAVCLMSWNSLTTQFICSLFFCHVKFYSCLSGSAFQTIIFGPLGSEGWQLGSNHFFSFWYTYSDVTVSHVIFKMFYSNLHVWCFCPQWFQRSPSLPSCQTVTPASAPSSRWLQTDWPVKPKKQANAAVTRSCSGMKTSPCENPLYAHTNTVVDV